MTALEEREGLGCLARAEANEPVFVLRGQDTLAPVLIRAWAGMVMEYAKRQGNRGQQRKMEAKAKDALVTADLMERWEPRQLPD